MVEQYGSKTGAAVFLEIVGWLNFGCSSLYFLIALLSALNSNSPGGLLIPAVVFFESLIMWALFKCVANTVTIVTEIRDRIQNGKM